MMAAAVTAAASAPRRRKMIGHRRRIEDEAEDEGGIDTVDIVDDDSLTEGSIITDDNEQADDSDTSNVDEASPTSLNPRKAGNGAAKTGHHHSHKDADARTNNKAAVSDTELMLHGLNISEQQSETVPEMDFDEINAASVANPSAPLVVSSSSAAQPQQSEELPERRRRDHDAYRRKREEDPAFVPNRGAFFMHDHRNAGPSANGFRPFGRGRGRGRGGIGGPFAPINQLQFHPHNSADPTTNAPWAHDMHEVVANPLPPRQPRHVLQDEGPPNGTGFIPTCPQNATPINRTMSTEKHIGNVQVRVFFPPMKTPVISSPVSMKQYTKLPDHRPPLRRDKPVRISLPNHPPRYIFPALDRSFIFIPRAMRPNQQRVRGKPRSGLGSVSGFSRRTSIFGGSYYGSTYTPSIAMSRRSSFAPEVGRDFLISPTGSTMSRPPLPVEASRPVVRLPPQAIQGPAPVAAAAAASVQADRPPTVGESSISEIPQPQTHPLPQKPIFQENRVAIPMHQPRPKKAVSLADIEPPAMQLSQNPQPYQQAFHQQVPVEVTNGFQESHHRHPSYHSTGTPLSHIPERAIHAAPFQPNAYAQSSYYGQPYQMMPPQQGYFYPPTYTGSMGPSVSAPGFVPGVQQQQPQPASFAPQGQTDMPTGQQNGPPGSQNLVAQEVNGMVYYYDASQLPTVPSYPSYSGPQGYMPGVVGMGGMMTPSPDGFYYPQPAPGMVYYQQ